MGAETCRPKNYIDICGAKESETETYYQLFTDYK